MAPSRHDHGSVFEREPMLIRRETPADEDTVRAVVAEAFAAEAEAGSPLLGHSGYYPRFGFRPGDDLGVLPPVPRWGAHFQVRPLAGYDPSLRGMFRYAAPFRDLG